MMEWHILLVYYSGGKVYGRFEHGNEPTGCKKYVISLTS